MSLAKQKSERRLDGCYENSFYPKNILYIMQWFLYISMLILNFNIIYLYIICLKQLLVETDIFN